MWYSTFRLIINKNGRLLCRLRDTRNLTMIITRNRVIEYLHLKREFIGMIKITRRKGLSLNIRYLSSWLISSYLITSRNSFIRTTKTYFIELPTINTYFSDRELNDSSFKQSPEQLIPNKLPYQTRNLN
ncbi:hypothetical protein CCUS01_03416 [Colletotrichum cuscutae]|uniref:Uncharacterized protein n=1 Tax=Colletotrichum cuscutae TaxID=1209917 RepID=A0AAJ0DKD8_9PEZI|nr:hypothetical protein CCUS01_03416 [Colletotrichum cuscutae]